VRAAGGRALNFGGGRRQAQSPFARNADDIADSLAAVHRAGMAHRDVKPPNILLAPGDRVVLTDFGIFQPEMSAYKNGDTAGSPLYMAPETILKAVRPGEAYLVDVYALGVVLFELLTSELPFDAADELAFDMIERSRSTPMSSMAVSYVLTRLETNV